MVHGPHALFPLEQGQKKLPMPQKMPQKIPQKIAAERRWARSIAGISLKSELAEAKLLELRDGTADGL
jgi:hypothetical protein